MAAVGADADEVGALGEHNEAVAVGGEPGVVGGGVGGGSHEDVFAGGLVLELGDAGAVPGGFFTFDGGFVGEEAEGGHIDGVSLGGGGEALVDEEGRDAEEGAVGVKEGGEVFLGGVGPGEGGVLFGGGFQEVDFFANGGDLIFGGEVDFAIERVVEDLFGGEGVLCGLVFIDELELAVDFDEGGGDGADGGFEFCGVGFGDFADLLVEAGEGFDLVAEHFDFSGVFFVVGVDEGEDAFAFLVEIFGEEVDAVEGVFVLIGEEAGEAFFVCGAGFFEGGAVDGLGGFAVELEGAVGGLAAFGVLVLHPLEGFADGHGGNLFSCFLGGEDGDEAESEGEEELHGVMETVVSGVTFSILEFFIA